MAFTATKNWNDYVTSAETVARGPGFQALRDRVLELADVGPGDQVLDLGSGTGLLALSAAQDAGLVWALDISEGMRHYIEAKARSANLENVEPIVASAVSVPLVEGSVTVVVSNYCFHHLSHADKLVTLQEARRVLAPGGRLVVADMMFRLGVGDRRNRQVVARKVRGLLAKGPGGAWRLARNGARVMTGRWECPATAEWWEGALTEVGFEAVEVEILEHEGGIARARNPCR